MTETIIACPSCKSLVLPDTAQCPNCHYVFDEKRATAEAAAAATAESPEEEVPCPGCNELVRKGLVRCWNCGTFMQQDIADKYRRMQVSPPKVIYSKPDDTPGDANAFTGGLSDSGRLLDQAPSDPTTTVTDDDFELSQPLDERDFDLGTAEPPVTPNEILESAPVYAMKVEPAPSAQAASGAAGKDATSGGAKSATGDSQSESANEFDNRFGLDDPGAETGEGLLRVALAEEAETGVRRRGQKVGEGTGRSGFRIYCPNGHRIEVQERHRGLTGRCPRCREVFVVPASTWDEVKATEDDEVQKAAALTAAVKAQEAAAKGEQPVEISAGEYTRWSLDSHLHTVDLTKLKLKAGSLLKEFQEVDLGFAPDGMLIVLLAKKGGLFGGGGDKKKLATREAILEHLSKGKARDDLPGGGRFFFEATVIPQIRMVQPIVSAEQSMFAGISVFGEGRIAIRLPKRDDSPHPQFLSYTLSEFRRFSRILEEFYGLKAFGAESGVPLADVFTERFCHFSDQPLKILENLDYYKQDPGFKLKRIGYKCAGCGLVVSEESREKEKIGGKDGKKIAKAKCPKCTKLFGDLPLFSLDVPVSGT